MTLQVEKKVFASYDDSGASGHKSCYVLEAGTYRFYVGGDVRSAQPAGTMELEETEVLEQCRPALAPVESYDRMKPAQASGTLDLSWEKTPLRTYSMAQRSRENHREDLPCTGDRGYRLADVYDNKISGGICVTTQ